MSPPDTTGKQDPGTVPVRRPASFGGASSRGSGPSIFGWVAQTARRSVPRRYQIRETPEGRWLRCQEAPGLRVDLEAGHAFGEAEAGKLGERVVLLDGAGTFAPTLDNEHRLYNLDHHTGCLRAFTLATCEQALIMVLKGLDLDKGRWTLYANEPDLDTVFALWVLLNHRRLRGLPPERRDIIAPMLRLEGAIDANGFQMADWCGLPSQALADARAALDSLQARELKLKGEGEWATADLLVYTADTLHEIDRLVYSPDDFEDWSGVEEEYDHVELGGDRVGVVVRDSSGIYEVEERLRKQWGDQLGLIVLEKGAGEFTLRRTTSFSSIDLEPIYRRLNLVDPAVDGRPPDKRWGGSDDIGGSPRPGGSGLGPREIADAVRSVYSPRPWWRWPLQLVAAAATTTLLVVLTLAGVALTDLEAGSLSGAVVGFVAAIGAWAGCLLVRPRAPWLCGFRWPAGRDWWLLVPVVLAAAVGGGVWRPVAGAGGDWAAAALAAGLVAVGGELWFRGLVHSMLLLDAPTQSVGGRWFVSGPALVSAGLYAGVLLFALPLSGGPPWSLQGPLDAMVVAGCGFVTGLGLAMIRERSLSVLPCAVIAALAALAQLAAAISGS